MLLAMTSFDAPFPISGHMKMTLDNLSPVPEMDEEELKVSRSTLLACFCTF